MLILLFDDKSVRRGNIKNTLKKIKLTNHEKIIIGHLNINSIRYKIEFLKELIGNNIDILLVSETKLNETFPTSQFLMDKFQVHLRLDRNGNGGGLLLFYRDHTPYKKIKLDFNPEIEVILIEINMKKRKWVLIGSYNPLLNELSIKYDNFILIGDFNSEIHEEPLNIFCTTYNLKNLIKEPTCFKNIDNPSCIDLILTNKPLYFQRTTVVERYI